MSDTSARWTLRDLPLSARLVLASFLISVGIGYFSALVQLHFQHAKPGSVMPTGDDAVRTFHGQVGELPSSRLVRLIEADESQKFNGSGQMAAAFTTRSSDWKAAVKARAQGLRKGRGGKPSEEELAKAEQELRKEREAEKAVVLAWLKEGRADPSAFEADKFSLAEELAKLPVTKDYRFEDNGPCVKIKALWGDRCARCHMKEGGVDAKASAFPLEKPEEILKYNKVEEASAMSLTKLAQTTHVHLLGFSMLYGLTGVILALTSYPGVIRLLLAPLPLLAQVVDISCWWLARLDAPHGPTFALLIPLTGAVVGGSLGLHILLTLWDLFGKVGKLVLVLLIAAAGGGAYVVKEKVIDPYMAKERSASTPSEH
ncbi:MAG: hypothetical protein U0797_27275 [Gemmataceae bacterium]